MSGRTAKRWIAAAGTLLVCAGCGFKGPLYLPERNGTVVTHPGQRAPSSGQAQTSGAKQKDKIPPAPPPPSSSPSPPQ